MCGADIVGWSGVEHPGPWAAINCREAIAPSVNKVLRNIVSIKAWKIQETK